MPMHNSHPSVESERGSASHSTTQPSSSPTATPAAPDANVCAAPGTRPFLSAAAAAPPSSLKFHARIREAAAQEVLDVTHSTISSSTGPGPRYEATRSINGRTEVPVPTVCHGAVSPDADGVVMDVGALHLAGSRAGRTARQQISASVEAHKPQESPTHSALSKGGAARDADGTAGAAEESAHYLLSLPYIGGPCYRLVQTAERVVPPGGHVSNIFNMASNTLGIGIVSMASGFNTTGIGLAVILMAVCAVLVVFSFYLIGATCERSPYRSWESACRGILFRGADYCVAGVMIFFQFGTMVGFVTAGHDLVGPFMVRPTPTRQRLTTAVVWLFCMLPLCLPRRVASLRYFSIVGVTLVIYFVFAVVAHSAMAGLPHLHDMKMFSTGLDAVNGLTLFIFAFLGHGLCFRLFDEMQVPSARNLLADGCGSVSLIGTLYFIVGFFGYAEFGLDMTGSIFKYYSVRDEPMMFVAYIGIMLKICVAYALSLQAARLPVYYILQRNIDESSYQLHLLITIPLCICSLVMGVFVPDINIVFNLLGSICGGILAFLLPAFFVMYIGGWTVKRVGWVRVGLTYLNMIAGVVAIVFGTAVTIDGMVKTYG